jgi:DNA-binding CsgD family transcriptional regulator
MLVMHATQENNAFNALNSQESPIKPLKTSFFENLEQSCLFQEVVEKLIDGILIVTEQREVIYSNENAHRILGKLHQGRANTNVVPKEIWYVCQSLIQSRSLFPNQCWTIQSRIFTEYSTILEIQVRWFPMETIKIPCLLITLEDRNQAIKNVAVEEAQFYQLTRREKEVWLLHRGHYTYKEIASELSITPNTVKKHMKSIHAKQKKVMK